MNVASTVTREAIAAGLGLGAAATAALLTKPAEQIFQLPVENVPSALQMDSLIQEMKSLEQEQLEQIWAQETTGTKQVAEIWSDEFVALTPDLDQAWADSAPPHWGSDAPQSRIVDSEGMRGTNMTAADFMNTVEKDLSIQESQLAGQWANEFEFEYKPSSNWADEFVSSQNQQQDFLQRLQNEWDQQLSDEAHSWLTPSSSPAFNQEYKFSNDNSYLSSPNPLADGRVLLEQGNIPSAVLAFEAAVQQNPNDAEAWVALGNTQAQNEQDPKAISALNRALEIQPNNLAALIALGASLTNEAFQLQAVNAFKRWLIGNAKYSHLVPSSDANSKPSSFSSVVSKDELKSIQDSFMKAARLNPRHDLDPDVQSGLGILFNLGNELDKAADCFRAALSVHPNDSLTWNRLGATLSNGGKPAEAIGAFRRALELTPGFIRTRYNLGISCSNLGANKEAAEHFLTALNQQQSSGKESRLMSDSIWTTLRMVLPMMGRTDLVPAVDARDLLKLNQEFNIIK